MEPYPGLQVACVVRAHPIVGGAEAGDRFSPGHVSALAAR